MKCPFCRYEELKVTDSRSALDSNAIRRRRECLNCNRRFTTFETIELVLQVHKRDGRYEEFQESKLISGLDEACRHTKVSYEQVRSLATKITGELMELQVREVSSRQIGEMVMGYLETMDMIAYIRFACVYRRFKNLEELMEDLVTIKSKDTKDVSV